jgi:hypothetical protein
MHRIHLLKPLFLACTLWAALPAQAADATVSTDQLVVKYRSGSAQRLDARSLSRAKLTASRFRMSVQSAAAQGGGTFVLRLDRCVPVKYAMALAGELESMDEHVEYARVDAAGDTAIAPDTDGSCSLSLGGQYATAR